jgi:hypothetical protein
MLWSVESMCSSCASDRKTHKNVYQPDMLTYEIETIKFDSCKVIWDLVNLYASDIKVFLAQTNSLAHTYFNSILKWNINRVRRITLIKELGNRNNQDSLHKSYNMFIQRLNNACLQKITQSVIIIHNDQVQKPTQKLIFLK